MDHVQHEQQLVAVVDQLRRERVPIEAQVPMRHASTAAALWIGRQCLRHTHLPTFPPPARNPNLQQSLQRSSCVQLEAARRDASLAREANFVAAAGMVLRYLRISRCRPVACHMLPSARCAWVLLLWRNIVFLHLRK